MMQVKSDAECLHTLHRKMIKMKKEMNKKWRISPKIFKIWVRIIVCDKFYKYSISGQIVNFEGYEKLSFAVHNSINSLAVEDNTWTVSETKTGYTIGQYHKTRKEAIEMAFCKLQNYSQNELLNVINSGKEKYCPVEELSEYRKIGEK